MNPRSAIAVHVEDGRKSDVPGTRRVGDIKRVLAAEISLAEVADRHARALDAQIRTPRLRRAVLGAVAESRHLRTAAWVRCCTLVGVVNGWTAHRSHADIIDAWEWYAKAVRAHA